MYCIYIFITRTNNESFLLSSFHVTGCQGKHKLQYSYQLQQFLRMFIFKFLKKARYINITTQIWYVQKCTLQCRLSRPVNVFLKVPKREIFDRSDFPDFYTIKSLRVGDFGVKIKNLLKNIWGFIQGCEVPYAYAQSIFKEVIFISFGQKIFFFC